MKAPCFKTLQKNKYRAFPTSVNALSSTLFGLILITVVSCDNTVEAGENISSSLQASSVSSPVSSSTTSANTSSSSPNNSSTALYSSDSLWTCTEADSSYELSASDTSMPVLSISIGGTAATAGTYDPGPVQFQAFMIFTRYGKHHKICPASDYGTVLKIVRGDEVIMAGARKTSEHGKLSMTIRQDEEYLYEEDFSESMKPRIYQK